MVTPVESDELLVNLTDKSMMGPTSIARSAILRQFAAPSPTQRVFSTLRENMASAWNAMPADPCRRKEEENGMPVAQW